MSAFVPVFSTASRLAPTVRSYFCTAPLARSSFVRRATLQPFRQPTTRNFSSTTPNMLKEGDKLPADRELMTVKGGKPTPVKLGDIISNKKVVIFTIPGALTPTCQDNHLPGYLKKVDELKSKGIDQVICLAANDPFVMSSFAKQTGATDKIMMLGDGDASFVKELGISFDTGPFGGVRARRGAMIVDDLVIKKINLEEGGSFEGPSKVETIMSQLEETAKV